MTATLRQAEKVYTLAEAAGVKAVSQDYIRRAIRSGALPAKLVGKGYRVKATDLDTWWDGLPDA